MYEMDKADIRLVCEKLQEYDVLDNKYYKGYKYLLSARRISVKKEKGGAIGCL